MIATAIVAVRLTSGPSPVDTDIQSMLPDNARDPVMRAAVMRAGEAASGRIAFLVRGADMDASTAAASALRAALVGTGLFTADTKDAEETGRWLFANRNALLCETDPAAFNADRTARSALASLYSPVTPVSGAMLAADPYLLTLRLSQCLAPNVPSTAADAVLISGRLNASAFRLDTQDRIESAVAAWRATWAPRDVTLARAGAVFHAAAAASRAKAEVAFIGGVGGLGVILLFWFAYRRFSSVLIAVASVYVGLVGGLAAAMLVFPSVHVMVFVFGATLIGIVSDYAVHFLATGPATRWADMRQRLSLVGRPITVSMITTALSFAAMALFNAPLFAQVAIFAAAGLVTAWAFVLAVLPFIDRAPKSADALAAWWRTLEDARAKVAIPPLASAACAIVILGAAIVGATRLTYLDDPRAFQPRQTVLLAEENDIRAAGENTFAPAFLLSEGATPDEARRVEEAALAAFPDASGILATSRFDPSPERRAVNAARIADLYGARLSVHLAAMGLSPEGVDVRRGAQPRPRPDWMNAWAGTSGGRHFLVAPVLAATTPAHGALPPGARLVTPADHYAGVFRAYRGFATAALIAAIVAAFAILLAVYRRWQALVILAAPLAGVAAGLAIPAAFGEPISFFSLVAALVLLGVGVDYSAFQWEAGRDDEDDRWTAVALPIDAATTALSMGLLMFSATQPLRNFGLTIAIGVAAALIFSYVPRLVSRRLSAADQGKTGP